jgi:translation initiation factor 4E binding protein 2
MNNSSNSIQIRRVSITKPEDLPNHGIAETPGGTLFGTTPGGTRIIYDRLFLLQRKTCTLANTPPRLPSIPGVTVKLDEIANTSQNMVTISEENKDSKNDDDTPVEEDYDDEDSVDGDLEV